MLFSKFGINYNDIDARFRKGSTLTLLKSSSGNSESEGGSNTKLVLGESEDFGGVMHVDMISEEFWEMYSGVLK